MPLKTYDIDYSKPILKIKKEKLQNEVIECFSDDDLSKHQVPYIQTNNYFQKTLNHRLNITISILSIIQKDKCKSELYYYFLLLKILLIITLYEFYYSKKLKRKVKL